MRGFFDFRKRYISGGVTLLSTPLMFRYSSRRVNVISTDKEEQSLLLVLVQF